MLIVKSSGEKENFDIEKIKKTCLRAGASKELAEKVSYEVSKRVKENMTTKEIFKLTIKLLEQENKGIAAKYDLKGAILRLGPAGFAFEQLIAEILREYGYSTKVHSIVRGKCISHEIDVIASKDSKTFMIEAKYHNMPGVFTGVRELLYSYARFLDLQAGYKTGKCQKFDEIWLVTNTKLSRDAIQYAECMNLKISAWNFPKENNLQEMIENKRLYPITMLRKLDADSQDRLADSGLVLVKDLVLKDISKLNEMTKISKAKLETLKQEAQTLI